MCDIRRSGLEGIGGMTMSISYNRLWKLLVDKKMSKADLRKAAGISGFKLIKDRNKTDVLEQSPL